MKRVLDSLVITSENKMVNASTYSYDDRLRWIIQ